MLANIDFRCILFYISLFIYVNKYCATEYYSGLSTVLCNAIWTSVILNGSILDVSRFYFTREWFRCNVLSYFVCTACFKIYVVFSLN